MDRSDYVNYAKEAENPPKTYFYVFNSDTYGFTADGEHDDTGVPFDTVQADGKVTFTFGGDDSIEEVLVITGEENGVICGYFEDIPERELVFEPVPDADPDGFSAVNYINAANGEDIVYRDANGWSENMILPALPSPAATLSRHLSTQAKAQEHP